MSEIQKAVDSLISHHPDIQTVYLFGSFASGVATPRSDVDLLIVAENSSWEDVQPALLNISVPVDCHLVRPHIFEQQLKSAKGIVAAAVRSGIRIH